MPPASKIKVAFYCFFPGGGIGQYTHELLTQLMCLESLTVSLYCPPNFEWLNKAKLIKMIKLYVMLLEMV